MRAVCVFFPVFCFNIPWAAGQFSQSHEEISNMPEGMDGLSLLLNALKAFGDLSVDP